MTDTREWQDLTSVPLDGGSVELKLEDGFVLRASWQGGFMSSAEDDCSCWVADEDADYPDCWTDGACWESNANECMSLQPEFWRPAPQEQGRG